MAVTVGRMSRNLKEGAVTDVSPAEVGHPSGKTLTSPPPKQNNCEMWKPLKSFYWRVISGNHPQRTESLSPRRQHKKIEMKVP